MLKRLKSIRTAHYYAFFATLTAFALLFAFWRAIPQFGGRFFGDFFYPYLKVTRLFSGTASDGTLLFAGKTELAERVKNLERENAILAAQARGAAVLLQENARLRLLLNLHPPAGWEYVSAEIILRDPWFWDESMTLDRGSSDGVEPGAAVIAVSAGGRPVLLGAVDRTTRHTATVLSIFHPSLRLSALLPSSGQTGIINASGSRRGGGTISLEMLPARGNYMLQEAAMTTGFEKRIPAGLKIGNLTHIDQPDSFFSSRPHASALVAPELQPSLLRHVLIARRKAE